VSSPRRAAFIAVSRPGVGIELTSNKRKASDTVRPILGNASAASFPGTRVDASPNYRVTDLSCIAAQPNRGRPAT